MLLDVQRTAIGLPALQALDPYAPHPIYDSGTGLEETRYRRLSDLSEQFAGDVAWLNRSLEGMKAEDDFRKIGFNLGRGQYRGQYTDAPDEYGLDIELEATFRPSVPPTLADRCAWAFLFFPGGNYKPYLTPENAAWRVIRAMLEALQPIYAFTTLDTDSPSLPDEYEHFRRAWQREYSSIFLGPELVRLIPEDLLDPSAGFSHIERLGEGVWLTIARAALYQPELESDKAEAKRHYAATAPLWAFLKTILPSDLI
ncbi:hypothetical protein Q0M94_11585 [Deinococcus radiomollis]|uniref:hypothetical protein n=1 Tax=Deinococcus radiomollis TaxID=468916 RepID=UPI003892BB39